MVEKQVLDCPILVVVDHEGTPMDGYSLTKASTEVLTLARGLTSKDVVALPLNIAPDIDQIRRFGANMMLMPQFGEFTPRVAAVVADCVEAAVESLVHRDMAPCLILCVSNYRGKELAGRVAVRLGSASSADVSSVRIEGGQLKAQRRVLSGTWVTTFAPHMPVAGLAAGGNSEGAEGLEGLEGTAEAGLGDRGASARVAPPILAIAPGSVVAQEQPVELVSHALDVDFRAASRAVAVEHTHLHPKHGPALTEAPVVVCVGRGVNGDVSGAQALAELTGGALGATRVAADEGWVDRTVQIGQTGVNVSPRVYVGLGVSGAVHHTTGIQGAEKIVAICDDAEAPIFEIADLGVVGAVEDVLPAVLENLS
ncbi:MAG: electron transfer flavoprotein subunit alpha/FixB family protein [Actinomycetaceae bacterium]|nr:electron transfer flavoprotein subunit alpha/FixB family protein [Actinomycetaceae bacterium]